MYAAAATEEDLGGILKSLGGCAARGRGAPSGGPRRPMELSLDWI